ncbi:alpha/beta hydrolase family protein [Nannocystis exedens]|uniref:alpha/beta hydrolase family protein n=1 Tax=Nannocystis exedens TaxID=54 RepID=UPI000BB9FFFF|nr:prolyl oligopeptidase family serine peptidase [Nannocystis exedens]
MWDARDRYDSLSPIESLEYAVTPTLSLQGEDDQRCPIGRAEELFATLVRAGEAPVEQVRYPGGDHHLAEQGAPSHRVDFTRRIVEWAERWAGRHF